MKRLACAALAALVWTTVGVSQQPALAKTVEVEFKRGMPKRGSQLMYEFELPLQQGDRFRFQAEPMGGAEIHTWVRIIEQGKSGNQDLEHSDPVQKMDYTMKKAPPGKSVRVQFLSGSEGTVNLRVTKVGEDTQAQKDGGGGKGVGSSPTELQQEVATLRKEVKELREQMGEMLVLMRQLKSPPERRQEK